MKVLVTGATGFVGGHLVDALQDGSTEITILVRSPSKATDLLRRGARVIAGDLHDAAGLEQATRAQDVIYHVAGVVAARNEADFHRANEEGTRNLLLAAERQGTPRFVLVSSLAAAGPARRGAPLSGAESPHPVTAYGRSKLAAEQVVRSSSLPWSIIRPPIVYGPRDKEVLKIFRLAKAGLAPVFGDGHQELSAIHAKDLARALIAVTGTITTIRRTYHACHPEIFTSRQLGQAVAAAMGRSVLTLRVPQALGRGLLALTETSARLSGSVTILTTDKANEFFQPAWTGDPSPLTRDSGWKAEYDLTRGMAETYDWYRKAGWL
jgi:nucleoside-diphosphate-sugar epimerase